MAHYLKKLFRFIFGETEETPAKEEVQPKAESTLEPSTEDVEDTYAADLPEWEAVVVRYNRGKHDVLGKFYLNGHFECFTLEPLDSRKSYMDEIIPMGSYSLNLRREGGKNVAYYYRYKAMHRGMLWVKGAHDFPFALIHEGNHESDVPGSILIGELPVKEDQTDEPREVWYSDQAYRKIYPKVADHLAKGGIVTLSIREA